MYFKKIGNNNSNCEFTVENNLFSDTCFGAAKTLFINIKINNQDIILTYKEGEIVNFNSIMSILNLL